MEVSDSLVDCAGLLAQMLIVSPLLANTPIRVAPSLLLFPKPSSLKDIYWNPKLNNKSGLYGTGILGPPHLFSTLDGEEHRALRKALGGNAVCFPLNILLIGDSLASFTVVHRLAEKELGT
jgi:hypothetical protein